MGVRRTKQADPGIAVTAAGGGARTDRGRTKECRRLISFQQNHRARRGRRPFEMGGDPGPPGLTGFAT